jgi:hypothetical protein
VVVTLGATGSVTLQHLQLSDLHSGDFLFA